jgi:hypothetical protein
MKREIAKLSALFMILSFHYAASAQNLAKGKIATQSSIYYAYKPEFAVDGDEKGQFTHTNSEQNAWWQVDLGASYTIGNVVLWNRADNQEWSRLSDFYIFVSEAPFSTTDINQLRQSCKYVYNSGQIGASKEFSINSRGRYVRIELSGTNYLSLSEVQVFPGSSSTAPDLDAAGEQNVALKKAVQQSSTYAGFGPEFAVDGDEKGQFTHTNFDQNAWWQVDLGKSYKINRIKIWNRPDGFWERLSNFYIFISETPFNTNDINQLKQGGSWLSCDFQVQASRESLFANNSGRYVRIELSGTNYLSLAEVEIFSGGSGTSTPTPTTNPAPPSNPAPTSGQLDLTGVWRDNNGATYSIRQVGNQIWWYMDGRPNYTNVFRGILSGNTITGEWCDVPGGKLEGKSIGSLTVKVVNNGRMEKVADSPFRYGGSVWSRLFVDYNIK